MNTLKGKTILLTGSGGFIGRRLKTRMLAAGSEVHSLVRASSGTSEHVISGEGLAAVECLEGILQTVQPDIVIHLASLFLAQHTSGDIDSLIDSNIRLGLRLLEAMDRVGIKRFINTGTFWQHFENRDYDPVNLYAATKQAFEDILIYYANGRGFACATLQLYDTYGPGDTRAKILALLERTAREGSHLGMSPGQQLLDLVHVDDVCSAFELCAARILEGAVRGHEVYSVSSGSPLRLREMVELFSETSGRPLDIGWGERPYRPREVMEPYNRGKAVPGWKPVVALRTGLAEFLSKPEREKQ